MSTFARLSATAIAASVTSGAVTALAVMEDTLARLAAYDAHQPQVWISRADPDALRAAARAIDVRVAAGAHLPLAGVPFAAKDNIDVAGLETTAACPAFAYRPERSATVIERLEAAGAICVGKTNLDQFATGLVGTRSPYGIPRNAYNRDYVSGGSSSGSAIAVAAGLVAFALGTDTAGSGRVPAAFNHLIGLKPTKGRWSTRGLVPACRTLDCITVFTDALHDAQAVDAVIAGFDAEDAFSRPRSDVPMTGRRIGVPRPDQRVFFGDVLAFPTTGTTYRVAELLEAPVALNSNLGLYTNFVNLLDMAALAVPAGARDNGTGFGITLIGPAHSDLALIDLAGSYLASADLPPPPPLDLGDRMDTVKLAVVGAHLEGMPLHWQLTSRGATFVGAFTTAPNYRLYAMADSVPPKPALVHSEDGAEIALEVYELDFASFGSFVAEVPPPLAIGTVTLADGSSVKGFVAEPRALTGAEDITHLGGWRAYIASR